MTFRMLSAALGAAAAIALSAGTAHADFDVTLFDGEVVNRDAAGLAVPATQAGSHPDEASTTIEYSHRLDPDASHDQGMPTRYPTESPKDVLVDLPAGFIGNPAGIPRCPAAEMKQAQPTCPPASQVGIARIDNDMAPGLVAPVYNIVPPPGSPAAFAFKVLVVPIFLRARVRPEDNGISIDMVNASQAMPIFGTKLTLWGVPADPSHDAERAGGALLNEPLRPFLTNPTSCTGPVDTTLTATSWAGSSVTKRFTTHLPAPDDATLVGAEGCEKLPFDPLLEVLPDTRAPDTPAGVTVKLGFPQDGLRDPDGLATAHLKRAKVTLPEGMTINPAAADGLTACADAQLKLKTVAPLACPESSKIGTVTADTPLLDDPLTGGIYLRPQASSDPESGEMFRVALALEHKERGVVVRLPGQIRANKATGRLETTFDDNPQLPMDQIALQFKGGPRAPLVTPSTCGRQTTGAQLDSWAGHSVARQAAFTIDCPAGAGAFTPSLRAGTTGAGAGAFAPFALRVAKPDGQAALTGLSLTLPTGLLAKLKGNVGTRVGSVRAFTGPGTSPYVLPGSVFLEGPYGDAPFSLRVVIPAKAGPFDLGEVVVRQRIYVDPLTAAVTIVSDPLPAVVGGVPVKLQRLEVDVDKPGFMVNPTSCAAKTVGGTLGAADGRSVALATRFRVSDCGRLALKPKLRLRLTGRKQTTDGKHPGVNAVLTQRDGGANLRKVRVTLPLSLALDPLNAQALCEFEPGSKVAPDCPEGSIVGRAKAVTPILDQPLEGPVYFVKNVRITESGRRARTLPKLVMPLKGNGVALTLTATSAVDDDGRLVTTFDAVPDAPVSRFELRIAGGKNGILVVSDANLCKGKHRAAQEIDGQNRKRADRRIRLSTPCTSR